jgi:hypothetical protein
MPPGPKRTASQFWHHVSIGTFSLHGGDGDDVLRDDALRMAGENARRRLSRGDRGRRVMPEEKAAIARIATFVQDKL